jgi:chromosome segregation ATPase
MLKILARTQIAESHHRDSLGALNSTVTAIITDLAAAKQSIIDISRDVPSIRATVDRIDQESPNISNEVVLIGSNVHDIKEDMQLIRSHLQTSKERLDALPLIQERIDTLPASLVSSITLQLESHSRERHQLQSGGLGISEIAEKIDALVCA